MANDGEGLSSTLLSNLIRVTWNAKMHIHQAMVRSGYDIRPEQMMVLGFLWRMDGISQTEICNFTGKSKSFITRTLDKLVKNNWVYRKTDPNDRRSFLIYLTEQGKDLKEKIFPVITMILNTAFQNFSNDEVRLFSSLLERMNNNLDELDTICLDSIRPE